MSANEPAPTLLRFGIFEADVQGGRLTKRGKRVKLQEQPFRLLVLLLEAAGEVVTREQLRSRLWPQTIVDFDHGLNKAISKIRDALGDSSEHPRFVETIARRGYRFLADVTIVHAPPKELEASNSGIRRAHVRAAFNEDDTTNQNFWWFCLEASQRRVGSGGGIIRLIGILLRRLCSSANSVLGSASVGESLW